MKIIKWLLFFLLIYTSTNGQQVDSDSLINDIKHKATTFFVQKGIIDKTDSNNDVNRIFLTEINERKVVGYSTNGIYRVGVFISHTPQYLLIKEGSNCSFLDVQDANTALEAIILFSRRNKLNTEATFSYLREVMKLYENNNKSNSGIVN